MILNNFLNIKQSSASIIAELDRIVDEQHISLLDAVVHYCEKHNYEIESIARIIAKKPFLKKKIKKEAKALNLLAK